MSLAKLIVVAFIWIIFKIMVRAMIARYPRIVQLIVYMLPHYARRVAHRQLKAAFLAFQLRICRLRALIATMVK